MTFLSQVKSDLKAKEKKEKLKKVLTKRYAWNDKNPKKKGTNQQSQKLPTLE